MNQVSCRESVPYNSRSNPVCGWHRLCSCCHRFNCRVGVERNTEHRATDSPFRTPSTIAPRPRMESAATDSIISPLVCATTLSRARTRSRGNPSHVKFALLFLVDLRVVLAIAQETNRSCHTVNCILRTHTFTTQCTQCASTALMAASPVGTTSKHTTTNFCMSVTTKLVTLGANPSDGQRTDQIKHKMATRMPSEVHVHMQM